MYSEVETHGSRDFFQWSAQSTICRRRKGTMIRFMYICGSFGWERDGQVLSLFDISAAQDIEEMCCTVFEACFVSRMAGFLS